MTPRLNRVKIYAECQLEKFYTEGDRAIEATVRLASLVYSMTGQQSNADQWLSYKTFEFGVFADSEVEF
jgi:hypothetical protein